MFNRPVTLQVCYASKSEDANQRTTSQEVFFKNLDALYRFIRPYGLMGTVIAITSVSLLPLQNLDDLTPTYFMGFLKAMVPGLLMTVYEFAINQLYDVKIDKINKPDLPLTSGDVSMRTGIAIASSSLLVSLAMGIMLRSPPLLLALIIWFLLASAYSVDKYVLGRQIAITRTLMFAVAIKCCFCFVISLLKDIPDEDGDREFGIQTPSVILGKESVLWLCVYVLLISYGAVIIVGLTSSPYLLSKLVMIISHIMLATLLWHQARTVDLSSKASTLSFYMFIWKGKDKKEYENVPDHGSLPSVGSKGDNLVPLGNHDISIASEAFNKFGDEAIPEKDNSWEKNFRTLIVRGGSVRDMLQPWESAIDFDARVYPNLMRVFYSNMEISVTRLDKIVTQVGGVPIEFDVELLNNILGISNDSHRIYTSRKAISFNSFAHHLVNHRLLPYGSIITKILRRFEVPLLDAGYTETKRIGPEDMSSIGFSRRNGKWIKTSTSKNRDTLIAPEDDRMLNDVYSPEQLSDFKLGAHPPPPRRRSVPQPPADSDTKEREMDTDIPSSSEPPLAPEQPTALEPSVVPEQPSASEPPLAPEQPLASVQPPASDALQQLADDVRRISERQQLIITRLDTLSCDQ
ncbi:homogentisate geranylgeranyltransferase [Citrus sinensis]|uniref:Homogentisate geranylgeranyltransferase n=1 Tax=Citrus sinensis TaxID=2711 RepID=A0ACB8N2G0_CITSI|nr:homogentisate geranylgeranyltransferase [Citrus sinensis]